MCSGGAARSVAGEAPLAGVILAAGLSTRAGMGTKLLLPVEGEAMVARVAATALAAGLAPVVVVTGHEAPAVEAAVAALGIITARNPDPARGLASSLVRGIEALPASTRGVVVLLGDMPWVAPATVRSLMAAFRPHGGRSVCAPRHAGRRGNPVLWGAEHFPAIRRLTGDAGAGRLLERMRHAVAWVDVDDPGVLRDVDHPDDLPGPGAHP